MENTPPCNNFLMIMADLESENPVANVAAINHASALIAGGKLPEPLLLCHLIAGLASNLAKPHHEVVVKRDVYSIVKAIRGVIISNYMNMDSSACDEALRAIQSCFMDEFFRRIQHHERTICSAVLVLDRLKQISMTMVDHPRIDELALDVLAALANPNFAVRKKVLNLAVSFLTPGNVGGVLRILMNELDLAATSDIPIEYQKMLEEAITECHSAYRESIMQIILDPKYFVFIDCIRYIKDIMDCNPLLGPQLLKGLLRAPRHVRSSPVCAAAVWAISVCSDSLLETHGAMVAISPLFKDLMDRRDIEKLIIGGGEVEHEYMLASDCYGVKEGDAQEQHLQPWLMEMEELLFVHIGLTRQADGSYAIASSSKSSASSDDVPSLDHTDNLAFLMQSGDALLADFVENMLSKLVDEDEEWQ
ncbi:hypothetical protein C2845_PM15G01060 [Panicum miliaceum]|uniref:Coatomer subunit beta-1-like n=1 Tax=Panicum miliaceum TaxID=4540 RepID=A0A3L6QAH1_PANMI|nr:hypothetical protein C2845_PM15G01060 [Panicum miliaceum]